MHGIKKAAKPATKPAKNMAHNDCGALVAETGATTSDADFITCGVSFLASTRLSVVVVISVKTIPEVSGFWAFTPLIFPKHNNTTNAHKANNLGSKALIFNMLI